MVFTETWLHCNILDTGFLKSSNNFNLYRCDRVSKRGGGTLIAVSKKIKWAPIHIPTSLETNWVCIDTTTKKIVLGVCYRPPNSPATFTSELHDVINLVITRFQRSPVFLLGDFNFPHINWSPNGATLHSCATLERDFLDMCTFFNLSQLVYDPTRIAENVESVLDLVLTSAPDLCSDITYLPGLSDHLFLHFCLDVKAQRSKNKT